MRIVSVNVSAGRTIEWQGRTVHTGIFKEPVEHRVTLFRDHVDGDRQADRKVHGGPDKAVYAYARAHYDWWAQQLGRDLPFGAFGENLTIDDLDEDDVAIGDRFAVGSAVLEAVQPRLPCYKLGIRFNDPQMVRRFMESGRYGTYFRVLTEGDVGVGDEVRPFSRATSRVPVKALVDFLDRRDFDPEIARQALALPALPASWGEHLADLLAESASA